MSAEICGDGRMTLVQRLRYLSFNLARNLQFGGARPRYLRFLSGRLPRTPSTASPGRALTEAFLITQLPKLLRPGTVRVLEIGCGSGSLTQLLAEIGYSGSYVGVDIADRFSRLVEPAFERRFVLADAHNLPAEGKFDLVISVSALEHIPEDHKLVEMLAGLVAPTGLQVHFVPTGLGLFAYLWHGYRQYTSLSIGQRFDLQRTTVFAMGGATSSMLHLGFITLGEMLLRLQLRQRLPSIYGYLLKASLVSDRLLPLGGTMCAICQTASQTHGRAHE